MTEKLIRYYLWHLFCLDIHSIFDKDIILSNINSKFMFKSMSNHWSKLLSGTDPIKILLAQVGPSKQRKPSPPLINLYVGRIIAPPKKFAIFIWYTIFVWNLKGIVSIQLNCFKQALFPKTRRNNSRKWKPTYNIPECSWLKIKSNFTWRQKIK